MNSTLSQTSTIGIKPLSSAIGIEVSGIDLSQPLDDAGFGRIQEAWAEGSILLFRGQQLDEDQQLRFCGRFGPLVASYDKNRQGGSNQIMYISNIMENGRLIGALPDGEICFHSDQCHVEQPAMATMLYAMEIPSHGGDTLFANMYKVYDTLPEELKIRLEGRTAENVYDYDPSTTSKGGSKIREGVKHFAHPVFRTHPLTRRKALYVNRLMTDHIVGLPAAESEELLNFLFDHIERPEFIYAHRWAVGDLLMWDNRCTQHARTDFDASERRKLRRITVRGEKPV